MLAPVPDDVPSVFAPVQAAFPPMQAAFPSPPADPARSRPIVEFPSVL
jgi:hypothetical protein